ncbi:hypothetical protein BDZ88DRAFT_450309 [Geranomyces variabilis]|nr:hypothetical protein BDZ88DRAFT_450309 [Geranomyces variabilis]
MRNTGWKKDFVFRTIGGLQNARKDAACGFCYVSDVGLGIQYLLRFFGRVLYVDIDVHHGDGVDKKLSKKYS